MLLANPALLISYPSEMIQVIAQAKAAGWQGEHYSLPPRGRHEQINLAWAQELGITSSMEIKNGKAIIRQPKTIIDIEKIKATLNQPKLEQTILHN